MSEHIHPCNAATDGDCSCAEIWRDAFLEAKDRIVDLESACTVLAVLLAEARTRTPSSDRGCCETAHIEGQKFGAARILALEAAAREALETGPCHSDCFTSLEGLRSVLAPSVVEQVVVPRRTK